MSITPKVSTSTAIEKQIFLINGPNLNLLGTREPQIYGKATLADVETLCASQLETINTQLQSSSSTLPPSTYALKSVQSNHEGVLIDVIHAARISSPPTAAIIINPGAFTHTSVALRDALIGVDIPFIEVHISNVHAREEFRHKSFLSDKAKAVICGLGVYGYISALEYVTKWMDAK
ncbi:MAG: hypothetical protein M1834_001308 [Cirrosporium novae-zelandiae]|nr:MAG: hypothetical protein M1834_001308 [Cirrosporium novae-zelandiae]